MSHPHPGEPEPDGPAGPDPARHEDSGTPSPQGDPTPPTGVPVQQDGAPSGTGPAGAPQTGGYPPPPVAGPPAGGAGYPPPPPGYGPPPTYPPSGQAPPGFAAPGYVPTGGPAQGGYPPPGPAGYGPGGTPVGYPGQQGGYRPGPGNTPPGQAGPGQPYPGQPYAGQPYPGQPYPGQPYPGQQYAGQPFAGQPYAGQGGQPGQAPAQGGYPGQGGYPPPPGQYTPPRTGPSFDPKKVSVAGWGVLGAAALTFVGSFFRFWSVDAYYFSIGFNGWSSWWWIPVLLAVAVGVVYALQVAKIVTRDQVKPLWLLYGAAVSFVLMLFVLLHTVVRESSDAGPGFGVFFVLLTTAALTYFTALSAQQSGAKLPVTVPGPR